VSTPFGEKLKPVLEQAVPVGTKLYAAPASQQAEAVPRLTDDELRELFTQDRAFTRLEKFARAIEAALITKWKGDTSA
jgi:hypothetical protein